VRVELWSEDEHRLGLKPILRRVWARRGERPLARVRPRYEWLYLVGFVHPESGRTSFWLVPRIDAAIFAQVLRAFAEEQQASREKPILLVLDRAGWHVAREIVPPEGVRLVFLPPYSPELQPAERLWSLCDEPLINRSFERLDQLEAVLGQRCRSLADQSELIRRHTLYYWWPRNE
jgi:transposase